MIIQEFHRTANINSRKKEQEKLKRGNYRRNNSRKLFRIEDPLVYRTMRKMEKKKK